VEGASFRLPRRLSQRRRGGTPWVLDEEEVGRWLRGELPRRIAALGLDHEALPVVAWGGSLGERHLRRYLSEANERRAIGYAIERLGPWAGHPVLSPRVWWEVCYPRRGVGFPTRLKLREDAWGTRERSLYWVVRQADMGVSSDPERELRTQLSITRYRLYASTFGGAVRFVEVWCDASGGEGRPLFELDDVASAEVLLRTVTPIHVVGRGVEFDLEPREVALLRSDASGWRRTGGVSR